MKKVLLPAWPASLPRVFKPVAEFRHKVDAFRFLDQVAIHQAWMRKMEGERMGGLTQTWTELIYSNRADFTAFASSASEGSIISGNNEQPAIPALYFDGNKAFGRTISLIARGVFSNTGTPHIIFQWRLGTTLGTSFLSGTSVGISKNLATASSTNVYWESRLDLICYTPGQGSGNTTLCCAGYVLSPTGFSAGTLFSMEPTTPETATWTATLDNTATQYVNLSVTWDASSASNTITTKQLLMLGLN